MKFIAALFLALSVSAFAQQSDQNTQVKINYLNVCTPNDSDQHELSAALDRLPLHPKFSEDFEVSRGRTTGGDLPLKLAGAQESPSQGSSRWVRVRKEFSADSPYVSTQYSLSVDEKHAITETLVFRSRENKDVIQTSLESNVSSGDPGQVLATETPADRIRIERYGKASVVLARCPGADQSKYDSLFAKASSVLSRYRTLLAVRQTVPADLKRIGLGSSPKPKSHANKKPAASNH